MTEPTFAEATYQDLTRPAPHRDPPFEPSTLVGLPAPAQRLLRRTLPEGVELRSTIHLDLLGEIKLGGRWWTFSARQLLAAGQGFVWEPIVGGGLVKVTGADVFGPSGAHVDLRLHGKIPLVRASGPGVDHSAAGRLAAETVAWIPAALTPQLGARWQAIDDHTATVTLDARGRHVTVEVEVADDGRLHSICLDRWNEGAKPPQVMKFGATMHTEHSTADGVLITGSGTVGWHRHNAGEEDGRFYRFRVDRASFAPSMHVQSE